MQKSKIFEVYEIPKGKSKELYTKSLSPGSLVYDEIIKKKGGTEYRQWNPYKSKLAASILKGAPNIFIRKSDIVLYLGASTGTTVSHVSDIVGEEGFVFAVDPATRVVRDLVFVCEKRKNIAPILEDAFHCERYKDNITKDVDVIYQDIAQRHQIEIFLKNIRCFLKSGGYAIIAVKSRSIDVTKKPKDIFKKVRTELEQQVTVVDSRNLEPYQKDHMIFFCKAK
ncbi:MAG: fibrillarin-like rRNA/tRNA 2'-O-methyltransferase [Candidatus Nanoarchaeia archaeon]